MKTWSKRGIKVGLSFALAVTSSWLQADVVGRMSSAPTNQRPILIFNEDDSHFFGGGVPPSREKLNQYVDRLSAAGKVTHFFMCVNAQKANFPSKVLEAAWEYDRTVCGKPTTWGQNLKKLHDGGIDPYDVWIRRCREKNVSPWISIRMNDVHYAFDMSYAGHSSFWREHPEFWRQPNATKGDWGLRALNYSNAEVRARILAFVVEVLERYDVDGIECDWMRFTDHLTPNHELEESACLNDLMSKIRQVVREASVRRSHPISIAARVDSDPEAALLRGTDPFAWASAGLIDILIPCNFFASADFWLPCRGWIRRIRQVNPLVKVVPGTDSGIVMKGTKKRRLMTIEEYCTWAERVNRQGADGVYVFNFFQHPLNGPVWNFVVDEGLASASAKRFAKDEAPDSIRECDSVLRRRRPLVGAIRWDAYQGQGDYNAVVEKTLSYEDQRWRAPWFSVLNTNGMMRIDGSVPGIMEREIDYAADAGLDYWAFVMYNPLPDVGLSRGLELYLKAKNRSRMRFSIIAHCHSALTDADWPRERNRWLEYLQEPGYVRVRGGRPLVYVLRMDDEKQADFRECAKQLGINPYFVQISSSWINADSKWAVPGGDACGRYAAVRNQGGTFADLVGDAERLWRLTVERGMEGVPLVTTGWEKTGRKRYPPFWELTQAYHRQKEFPAWPTTNEIATHLKSAMRFVVENPATCPANAVLIYAWNEHDEGGWLCPTWTPSGIPDTSRIDAVAEVLGKKSLYKDIFLK